MANISRIVVLNLVNPDQTMVFAFIRIFNVQQFRQNNLSNWDLKRA